MRWWSESKRGWIALADMHGKQLANAVKKLRRGEYAPPEPLSVYEELRLDMEIEAELERRGLDGDGREIVPEHTDADVPPVVDL